MNMIRMITQIYFGDPSETKEKIPLQLNVLLSCLQKKTKITKHWI